MSSLVSVEFVATACIEVYDPEDENELERGIIELFDGDVFLNEIISTGQIEVMLA